MPGYFSSCMNAKMPSFNWHADMTTAINNALNMFMRTMTVVCTGTVTAPNYCAPLTCGGTSIAIPAVTILEVKSACFGETTIPGLFALIGSKLAKPLLISGAPLIAGTTLVPFATGHFYTIGSKCQMAMKAVPPEEYDSTKFNTIFDNYLSMAINTTPPSTGVLTGAAPGGIFTGTVTCKLNG